MMSCMPVGKDDDETDDMMLMVLIEQHDDKPHGDGQDIIHNHHGHDYNKDTTTRNLEP